MVENVNAEDRVNSNNIRSIRPGLGLAPKFFNDVIGKKFKIKKGTPLTWINKMIIQSNSMLALIGHGYLIYHLYRDFVKIILQNQLS